MHKVVPHFWLAAVGVALTFLGLIGPWAKVTSIVSISVSGFDTDDGKFFALGAAAAGVLLAWYAVQKRTVLPLAVSCILGLLIAAGGGYYVFEVTSKLGEFESEFAHASTGWGLYATALGGLAIFAGSLFTITESRKTRRLVALAEGADASSSRSTLS
jgi:hypothetical protein